MKLQTFYTFTATLLLVTTATASNIRGGDDEVVDQHSILCRMFLLGTLYDEGTNGTALDRSEEPACEPIIGGRATANLIPLALPDAILSAHYQELQQGSLFVTVSNAQLLDDEIVLAVDSVISVDEQGHGRHLQQRQVNRGTTGDMTVAIVRISTKDSKSSLTNAEVDALFDMNQINFASQYHKCSFGKLRIRKARVIDVTLDKPIASFGTGAGNVVSAAQTQIVKNLGISTMEELADKVIFCVPPGTGGSWVASAGLNHWRSQYNDRWVRSLSATMHELGHNLGVLHSNENGLKYEDTTGVMARSYSSTGWPQRCFNGQHNHLLGWYDEFGYDPTRSSQSQTMNLATFVHYDKAKVQRTPVLINLADELFLQYNRAISFNAGTGEMRDMVTITAVGLTGSDLLGGLLPGQSFEMENFKGSQNKIVIRACQQKWNSTPSSPDMMVLSIGMGRADCNTVARPFVRSPQMTLAPTIESPDPPTAQPSMAPSVAPHKPAPAPTRGPSTFASILQRLFARHSKKAKAKSNDP